MIKKMTCHVNLCEYYQLRAAVRFVTPFFRSINMEAQFYPKIKSTERTKLLNGWSQGIRKTLIH